MHKKRPAAGGSKHLGLWPSQSLFSSQQLLHSILAFPLGYSRLLLLALLSNPYLFSRLYAILWCLPFFLSLLLCSFSFNPFFVITSFWPVCSGVMTGCLFLYFIFVYSCIPTPNTMRLGYTLTNNRLFHYHFFLSYIYIFSVLKIIWISNKAYNQKTNILDTNGLLYQ